MEKSLKSIKVICVILIVFLVSVVAFGGIYFKDKGVWNNVVKEFKLGMELKGHRELHYVLDDSEEEKEIYVDSDGNYKGEVIKENEDETSTSETTDEASGTDDNTDNNDNADNNNSDNTEEENKSEENSEYKTETRTIKANEDNDININNFEKSKKIIQKRLETISSYEYNIRQDMVTGEIVVELPDDDNLQVAESLISAIGKFEIIDSQTGLLLLDNSDITKVTAVGGVIDNQYQSYLQVEFTKEGKDIIKNISNQYKKVNSEDENTTQKTISIQIDGQVVSRTYFSEELTEGILQIPMGEATTNSEEYLETAENINRISYILNNEKLPLEYELSSDNFIKSTLIEEYMLVALITSLVIIFICIVYLVIKYRLNGLYTSILNIGYIALLTLLIRYTNVIVTLNSLIAFVLSIAINYIFSINVLKELKNNSSKKSALANTMKKLYLLIIPVCIIAIVFTLMSSTVISSIGMTLFWGLILQAICSLVILI